MCKDRDDIKEFAEVRAAMKILNFNDQDFWNIMKLLAVILHLGNLNYKHTVIGNSFAIFIGDIIHKNNTEILSFCFQQTWMQQQ